MLRRTFLGLCTGLLGTFGWSKLSKPQPSEHPTADRATLWMKVVIRDDQAVHMVQLVENGRITRSWAIPL